MEQKKKIDSGGYVYPCSESAHLLDRHKGIGITRRNQLIDNLVVELTGLIFESAEEGVAVELVDETLTEAIIFSMRIADLTIAASKKEI